VLIECVPRQLAKELTEQLRVPTIGIGAGPDCDGQVLVTHDLLGLTVSRVPKFVRQTVDLGAQVRRAAEQYNESVRQGSFPGVEESFD
jgi:3-methyl-2-oxobutanoate hydroxymethyltransferase